MLLNISISITIIIALGMAAQWLAWRFQVPSILLLLLFGFLAGPVFGVVLPDQLFGELLFPIISISVAIILFEGGLGLSFSELAKVGREVRNLIFIGTFVTWILIAAAAYFILKMDLSLSVLLGAILVVTGPTVIGPMLRHMKLKHKVASILKWEGIVIDPIGATLAVLVFEVIIAGGIHEAISGTIFGILKTLALGVSLGAVGAWVLAFFLKRYLLPDFLQSPVALMMVLIVFSVSNFFQPESGLLAATCLGVFLANQKSVSVKRIVEFKENLRVLLISGLFIVLASRLTLEEIIKIDFRVFIFLGILIVFVRPLAIFISTLRSKLQWKEKLILAWMAPRGIVAAAVASVFAFDLMQHGYPDAAELIPTTFMVIVGTVFIYGITTTWFAQWLGLAIPNPQGVVMVGAYPWVRRIASALAEEKFHVLLVDSNYTNVIAARNDGLVTSANDILSSVVIDELDLEGVGRIFALTPNNEVNTLTTIRFSRIFSSSEVYQLSPKNNKGSVEDNDSETVSGRYLFSSEATYGQMEHLFDQGAFIEKAKITKDFNLQKFLADRSEKIIPLFLFTPGKELFIFTTDDSQLTPKVGQELMYLVIK